MNIEASFELLDRALSNYQSRKLHPTANVHNLPILGSNHAPVVLEIGYTHAYAKWLQNPSFFELVKNVE